jgi:hypothetical protein
MEPQEALTEALFEKVEVLGVHEVTIHLFVPERYAGMDLVVQWSAASIEHHLIGRVGDELPIPVQAETMGPEILRQRPG